MIVFITTKTHPGSASIGTEAWTEILGAFHTLNQAKAKAEGNTTGLLDWHPSGDHTFETSDSEYVVTRHSVPKAVFSE